MADKSKLWDVLIVGGGQAGLATARALSKTGLEFAVLEGGSEAVGSWPQYYDSLHLFSPAKHSSLPELTFPGDPDGYPSRDEVVAYLREYQAHFDLPVYVQARVQSLHRPVKNGHDSRFELRLESGERLQARAVVSATGSFHTPFVPRIAGQADFTGVRLHSSQYRNPNQFAGQRVLVVGSRNSAVQIAAELAPRSSVTLAVRTAVRFAPKRILGRDFHDWLKWIDRLPVGHILPLSVSALVWDEEEYRAALQAGGVQQKSMFQSFTERGVVWTDGESETIDTVIFASGFRDGPAYLEGTEALDTQGNIVQRLGKSRTVPGLYFVGLSGARSLASATLRGVGQDARAVVRDLVHSLKPQLEAKQSKSWVQGWNCCF